MGEKGGEEIKNSQRLKNKQMKREFYFGNRNFEAWMTQIWTTKQKQCFLKHIYHGRWNFQLF